jgi:5-methylcytosine-specific restriction endonuclease McrA
MNKQYFRDYYTKNKDRIRPLQKLRDEKRAERRKQFIWDYLLEHPCVECGESNPVVLEFDHIDPSTKTMSVSEMMMKHYSLKRVQEEIEKCVVRCSNCHKIKTAEQNGWYRTQRLAWNLQ